MRKYRVYNNKISEDEVVGHEGLTGDGIDGSGERLLCMSLTRTSTSYAYALLEFTCLTCAGPVMRATRAYISTNDVAAHCATVARRYRYSCTMSPHKTATSANSFIREALLALCVLLVNNHDARPPRLSPDQSLLASAGAVLVYKNVNVAGMS